MDWRFALARNILFSDLCQAIHFPSRTNKSRAKRLKYCRIPDRALAEERSIEQVGQVEGLNRDALILRWLHFENWCYKELGVLKILILRFGDGRSR
jgi:hypothetical protein